VEPIAKLSLSHLTSTLLELHPHIMPQIPRSARTEGSSTFDPDHFFQAWAKGDITAPVDDDFRKCVQTAFGLPTKDNYVYRAVAAVTLEQTQFHIAAGGKNGLHGWYKTSEGQLVGLASEDRITSLISPLPETSAIAG
jgi:hypothetical protein